MIIQHDSCTSAYMGRALQEAHLSFEMGEVPVGAVLVKGQEIIAATGNRTESLKDATAHAEILVLKEACLKLGSNRLLGCHLYVTLEPCAMCAGAISHARIERLYFGASDIKGGAVENGTRFFNDKTCHHRPEVYSAIMEQDCSSILHQFFKRRR